MRDQSTRRYRNVVPAIAIAIAIAGTPTVATSAVQSFITTSQPTEDGKVDIKVVDTNGNLSFSASASILKTDTPASKADKINDAINNAITAEGPPIDSVFSSAVATNKVTVTKTGGGGMSVNITNDTTGEGDNLKVKDSGGNGNNWFWRFVRWVVGVASVPPAGDQLTLTTTNGLTASVTTDGIASGSALQSEITSQLALEGVSFTPGQDPSTGQDFLASQFFAVGNFFPADGVGVLTSGDWGQDLGGIGVEIAFVPASEPPSLAILVVGLLAMLARRRLPLTT